MPTLVAQGFGWAYCRPVMRSLNSTSLGLTRRVIASQCTECGNCQVHCAYLKEYGTPREIAAKIDQLPLDQWPDPFECALCGLCGAVCPEKLRPEEMFLSMRRELAMAGHLDLKRYAPVLTYEKLGASRLLSLLRMPEGGDTVLFPGCALPSTRSKTVRRLFTALQDSVPHLGVALGCCMKPSYDLGRVDFFEERFGRLHAALLQAGVRRVITACPNCQKVFSHHGGEIETVTAYEVLVDSGYDRKSSSAFEAIIHDPCPQRHDTGVQDAVRVLAQSCGVDIQKCQEERKLTQCCGEGGMVKFVRPEFAENWTENRKKTAGGSRVVTSCAGCTGFLGEALEVDHVLDLLLDSKPVKPLKPPFTYAARFMLKRWFKKRLG